MKLIEETYQGEKESSKWPVTPCTCVAILNVTERLSSRINIYLDPTF